MRRRHDRPLCRQASQIARDGVELVGRHTPTSTGIDHRPRQSSRPRETYRQDRHAVAIARLNRIACETAIRYFRSRHTSGCPRVTRSAAPSQGPFRDVLP